MEVGCTEYDCNAGFANWKKGWSWDKKRWCCKEAGRGCPTSTSTTRTSTTWTSTTSSSTTSSSVTYTWTTTTWTTTTRTTSTVTTMDILYNCNAGFGNWEDGWSIRKKQWCCKYTGRGCHSTTTTTSTLDILYNCNAGFGNWEDGWSISKKQWCCKYTGRGCRATTVTTTTTPMFDCRAGFDDWEFGWSARKKQWCCHRTGHGCVVTSTTPEAEYNCEAGFANWQEGWSRSKKEWCCQWTGLGCIETTTMPGYDCDAGYANWQRGWSESKKMWCCQHVGRACATTTCQKGNCEPNNYPFDCFDANYAQWGEEKLRWCCKYESLNLPPICGQATTTSAWWRPATTTTTTTVRTWRPTASPPTTPRPFISMTCDLNCYGDGAKEVPLFGAGGAPTLTGVSKAGCREACFSTENCEGVTFLEGANGKGECWGKRDIHTSKCQPGGNYRTDVIGARPWGKCALMGDPHVLAFDRVFGPMVSQISVGDFHLIRSGPLLVQGRFGYTRRYPSASSMVGIAVGGDHINGHTLIVEYVGPETGRQGFRALWDAVPILEDYPSSFTSSDGVLKAGLGAMDPSLYHRDARHTIGGTEGLLPSYLFELKPDLNIYILIGPDNFNAVIETRKVAGLQDGYCGNFNCDPDDDSFEELRGRGVTDPIPEHESLFKFGRKAPSSQLAQPRSGPPSVAECDPAFRKRAEARCHGMPKGSREACVFDACASGSLKAAGDDSALAALAQQVSPGDHEPPMPMSNEQAKKEMQEMTTTPGTGCTKEVRQRAEARCHAITSIFERAACLHSVCAHADAAAPREAALGSVEQKYDGGWWRGLARRTLSNGVTQILCGAFLGVAFVAFLLLRFMPRRSDASARSASREVRYQAGSSHAYEALLQTDR